MTSFSKKYERINKALSESDQLYKTLFDKRFIALTTATSELIYQMNSDWKVMVHLNSQGFLKNTQEPDENWVKSYIPPQERDFVLSCIRESIENKSIFELEHRVYRSDGTIGWVHSKAVPILDHNGNITEWFGAANDITNRKNAEAVLYENEKRQRLLLTLSDKLRPVSDPIEIHGIVTRIAMEYFGADRCYYCEIVEDDAVIRQDASCGDLPSVAGVYPLSSLPIHKSLVDAGLPFSVSDVYTTEMVDEELRQLCIQLKVISYLDIPVVKNGKPVGILCIVQSTPRNWTDSEAELAVEISERTWAAVEQAKAENALKKSNEALERSVEMKDEFLSIISHEFKTPLNVIFSAIQMMEQRYSNELSNKSKDLLFKIKQNSFRQMRLVNNLLDITRVNAGSMKMKLTNKDIVYYTKAITESVEVYAKQKKILLEFSSAMKSNVIAVDEEFYERIVLNLLSNAIKFTKKGKTIQVKLTRKNIKQSPMVCLEVSDQGLGIPEEKINTIFERFGQVDSRLSRQAEGTGIGLTLVKMLVELMGGTISLESELGYGSTFHVLLPERTVEENHEKAEDEFYNDRLIHSIEVEFSDIYLHI